MIMFPGALDDNIFQGNQKRPAAARPAAADPTFLHADASFVQAVSIRSHVNHHVPTAGGNELRFVYKHSKRLRHQLTPFINFIEFDSFESPSSILKNLHEVFKI